MRLWPFKKKKKSVLIKVFGDALMFLRNIVNWLYGWRCIDDAKEGEIIIGAWKGSERVMTGYLTGKHFRSEIGTYALPTHFKKLPKLSGKISVVCT
jgi:hypothetical protein